MVLLVIFFFRGHYVPSHDNNLIVIGILDSLINDDKKYNLAKSRDQFMRSKSPHFVPALRSHPLGSTFCAHFSVSPSVRK